MNKNTSIQLRSTEQSLKAHPKYFSDLSNEEQLVFIKRAYSNLKQQYSRKQHSSIIYSILPDVLLVVAVFLADMVYRAIISGSDPSHQGSIWFVYLVGGVVYLSMFLKSFMWIIDRRIVRESMEELEKMMSDLES